MTVGAVAAEARDAVGPLEGVASFVWRGVEPLPCGVEPPPCWRWR